MSRDVFGAYTPPEQRAAADKTRKLIDAQIGKYADLSKALSRTGVDPKTLVRARNLAGVTIPVQTIPGDDANRAEQSFYRINQQGTAIDETEIQLIRSRKRPNAIATRAMLRAGSGHKYWASFAEDIQGDIEGAAATLYDLLFQPAMDDQIRTLDLPVGGRGYSAEAVRTVFDLVNFANGLRAQKDIDDCKEEQNLGGDTLEYLKKVTTLTNWLTGNHSSSLGLHPAVYFYGATARYQPPTFLAVIRFIQDLVDRDKVAEFTVIRRDFEEFLVNYKYFTNQIISKYGGGTKSVTPLLQFYGALNQSIRDGKTDTATIEAIQATGKLGSCVRLVTERDRTARQTFSRQTKDTVYLNKALQSALRCSACGARLHTKSISMGHVTDKSSGGSGNYENAQLEHFYCNSARPKVAAMLAAKRKAH